MTDELFTIEREPIRRTRLIGWRRARLPCPAHHFADLTVSVGPDDALAIRPRQRDATARSCGDHQ
jgi:hypothetical protein